MANKEDPVSKIIEAADQLESLLEQRDKKIAELEKKNKDLGEKHRKEVQELNAAIDALDKAIEEARAALADLTASPSLPVGKLVGLVPGKNDRVTMLDNHRALHDVKLHPSIKPEELDEGADAYYVVNEFGQITCVFAVRKNRREEEIVVVKEILNPSAALVVTHGDTIKIANIGNKLKSSGKLEKGDEAFYDPVINFITEKIEKTKAKIDDSRSCIAKTTWKDVGGLGEQIRRIKEVVELPLKHPEVFAKLGIKPQKGILLTGPPGNGKTLLGRALAGECDAFFILISGPEVKSAYVGESEARLRAVFETAKRYAPSIIFFDEIEAFAIKREGAEHQHEISLVSQLLTLMDGVDVSEKVIVIAATNTPDLLDPALRRPGRFDKEIVIPVPDRDGRLEILKIHSRNMPLVKDVNLGDLADMTHGFSGADLEFLCKEAAMQTLRGMDIDKLDKSIDKLEVGMQQFSAVVESITPSSLREFAIARPSETWADVGGLEEVKQKLQEAVQWPLLYPNLLKKAGQKPPKGAMLYGPPGCGKTLIARAAANECGVNFIAIKGPELIDKWSGESERHIRNVFKLARQSAPCIIFFDEIESLVSARGTRSGDPVADKVTAQLLTEMDGIEELRGVFILAATNRIDLVDPALLRPGRFEELIYLPPPNEEARLKIFEIHTKGRPLAGDVDLRKLAKAAVLPVGTEILSGLILKSELPFSGDLIRSICHKAAQKAIREFVADHDPEKDYGQFQISMKYFMEALEDVLPSVKASAQEDVPRNKKPEAKMKKLTDKDLKDAL